MHEPSPRPATLYLSVCSSWYATTGISGTAQQGQYLYIPVAVSIELLVPVHLQTGTLLDGCVYMVELCTAAHSVHSQQPFLGHNVGSFAANASVQYGAAQDIIV